MPRDQLRMSHMETLGVRQRNERELLRLDKGDMVEFKRGLYSHWAVYIGNEEVVHLAGDGNDDVNGHLDFIHLFAISGQLFNKAFVRIGNFFDVAGNCLAVRNNNKDKRLNPLPPNEIVQNALSKLGETGYNLFFKNCEHFASWCRYGEEKSDQVENFVTGLALGTAIASTASLLYNLSRGAKEER